MIPQPSSKQPPAPRLAIGAIVKNEAPYLLEWIAFHRVLGIERFFIADNGSTDGGSELLAALDAAGFVHHLPFPDRPDIRPQMPAYATILERHGGEADWIAFIDADEFLLPAAGPGSIGPILAPLDADPGVGAVVVNWALYGSSGHLRASPGLVIERFARRSAQSHLPNHHFKSMVRTRAVTGVGRNPHAFDLAPDFQTVHCDGREVAAHPTGRSGLSRDVIWSPLRINHYIIKSREEFMTRKLPRGRATTARFRNRDFFDAHDLTDNAVADLVPTGLAQTTRRERVRLMAEARLPLDSLEIGHRD